MLDAKGVMEPWQEPRSGRGWFVLVLGIVVFAAFGGVVGYAYFKGLPGIGGEPPLIRAEAGPYRVAPEDRGGLAMLERELAASCRCWAATPTSRASSGSCRRSLRRRSRRASRSRWSQCRKRRTGSRAGLPRPSHPRHRPTSGDLGTVAPDGVPAADALAMPYPRSKPSSPEIEAEIQAGPAETEIQAGPAEQPPRSEISALPEVPIGEPPATSASGA